MTATNHAKKAGYWSEDGQVFYLDDWAWSIELVEIKLIVGRRQLEVKNVCLGREGDIIGVLKDEKPIPNIATYSHKEES